MNIKAQIPNAKRNNMNSRAGVLLRSRTDGSYMVLYRTVPDSFWDSSYKLKAERRRRRENKIF